MWLYKPTGETFNDRLEAKKKLGHGFFNGALKYGDIIYLTDTTFANDEYTISTNSTESIRA